MLEAIGCASERMFCEILSRATPKGQTPEVFVKNTLRGATLGEKPIINPSDLFVVIGCNGQNNTMAVVKSFPTSEEAIQYTNQLNSSGAEGLVYPADQKIFEDAAVLYHPATQVGELLHIAPTKPEKDSCPSVAYRNLAEMLASPQHEIVGII
ncbi:hypothetical protein HY025_01975 [Candidatus Daviesbacteria bacterium]|nr:hypothetical protein [Candidatus Daviesbacteria bacterium]